MGGNMKSMEKQIDEMIKQTPRSYENERILYLLKEAKKEIASLSEKSDRRLKAKKLSSEQEIMRRQNMIPNRATNPNVLKGIDEMIKKEAESIKNISDKENNEFLNLNG